MRVCFRYETTAHTRVYQSEQERSSDLAMHAGLSASFSVDAWATEVEGSASASVKAGGTSKSHAQQHVAERKIDVKLYTLYADHTGLKLSADVYRDASELPVRFSDRPQMFLEFLRKWGRYVPTDVSLGGSLVIDMKFESQSSSQDEYRGVESAFDMVCSGGFGSAGASGNFGSESSSAAASLMSNSQISLMANGGDPQVASAITDFTPATQSTATFRGDIQAWLKSIPQFPRLVERIPKLSLISSILPATSEGAVDLPEEEQDRDRFSWVLRQRAMRQAIEVMETSSTDALHSSTQTCKTNFDWLDFNRFNNNECLSFGVKTDGSIDIALAEVPTKPSGAIILHIGDSSSKLQIFDQKTKIWSTIWASTDNLALTLGSYKLMSKFWLCLHRGKDEEQGTSIVSFGVRDVQLFEIPLHNLERAFEPRYFALKCSSTRGLFSSVQVDSYKHFQYFVSEKNSVETQSVCSIGHCKNLNIIGAGGNSNSCKCVECEYGKPCMV
jgi:hypothetical protein